MEVKRGALRKYLYNKGLLKPQERIPTTLLRKIKNTPDHSTLKITRHHKTARLKVTTKLKRRVGFALNFRKRRK